MATAQLHEPTSASDGNIPYIGATADDGTGNTLRDAIERINERLREIYGAQDASFVVQTPFIDADNIKDGVITEAKLDISNAAVNGYILSWNNTAGQFEWKEEFDGDITSIVAGDGLTGSSLETDEATLNVVGGIGITANANDIQITDGGVGTTQLADDGVTYAKLAGEFTTASPLTAAADLDVDFSTAAVFTTTSSGPMDLNFTNAGIGQVKTIVVTDSGGTSSLTFDTGTNTVVKLNGDYSATAGAVNYIQAQCIAANSFILTISQAAA